MTKHMVASVALAFAMVCAAVPAAAQTQADLNRTAAREFMRADAALNAQYRTTMAAMRARDADTAGMTLPGPGNRDALVAAQRAWIAWRDAECLIQSYHLRGGSAQSMEMAGCRTRLTQQRTAALRQLATD